MGKSSKVENSNKNKYKTNPEDNSFADGPTRNRKLTDFVFCILMLAFWFLCGYII